MGVLEIVSYDYETVSIMGTISAAAVVSYRGACRCMAADVT